MTGLATHDDDSSYSGIGFFRKDLEGELLGTGLNIDGEGSKVLDALTSDSGKEPSGVKKAVLWKMFYELYRLLPDGGSDRATRRTSISSSESNESVSFVNLQDSLARLKEDLLTSLPDLVAPKVSEILSPREDVIQKSRCDSDAKKNTTPDTPVKRFVSIKADKSDEGTTPICQKRWADVVKPKVEAALKHIPVLDTSVTGNHTQLYFDTEDDMNQAHEALSPFLEVTTSVRKEKKKDPRVMVSDLDTDLLEKDKLLEAILSDKNENIRNLYDQGFSLKVVHTNAHGRYAVIQVAPEIRQVITDNGERLFLKLRQHAVRNRFYVTQCFHCQRYGHVAGSIYCPNKDKTATCAFCAGGHDTRHCQAKKNSDLAKMKCVNCEVGGSKEDRRFAKSHPASSSLCPSYVSARARLMGSTSGVTPEQKNAYLTRAWEELRVKRRGGSVH